MSNQGPVEFCKQKQLSQTSFYRWKHKFDGGSEKEETSRKKDVENVCKHTNVRKHTWVEAIPPVSRPVSENTEIRVKFVDFTVIIPNHFEESVFLRVFQMLVSL